MFGSRVGRTNRVGLVSSSRRGPSLQMDFTRSGALGDSRVTAVRAAGGATYFDTNGVLQVANANTQRIDYGPTGGTLARGLLSEEARTNLLLQSGTMAIGAWSNSACPTTASAGTAPDGTNSAAKPIPTAVSTDHLISQTTGAATLAQVYSFTVFAKPAGLNFMRMSFGNTSGGGFTFFNLLAGTIGTTSGMDSSSIQACANGWYRCTVTRTVGTTGTLSGDIYVVNADNVFAWTGDAVNGILVWGGQVELGAFPTSYIPTVGATVTRATDLYTLPVPVNFNGTLNSWASELILEGNTTGAFPRIVGDAASAKGPITLTPAGALIGIYDLTVSPNTANTLTLGAVSKAASALNGQTATASLNGGTVISTAGYTNGLASITSLRLMGDSSATDNANGWMRRMRYWPRVLGNAELIAQST